MFINNWWLFRKELNMSYKYFSINEFKCPCCNVNKFNTDNIPTLDNIRDLYEKPLFVASGYRCEKHNKEVGGVIDSEHVIGEGVDFSIIHSSDRYKLLFIAINIGIKRIGIAKTFIHLGFSTKASQEVLWFY